MVVRFNTKIINVPYTNRHKSQIGEFLVCNLSVFWSGCCAASLTGPGSILGQDSFGLGYVLHVFNMVYGTA